MISTVILKPTLHCNADCTYCSAPPDGNPRWTFNEFRLIFDKLAPHLDGRAFLIWHGGEPMIMGPDFYHQCFEYARSIKPGIRFSMQSNFLLYSPAWRSVFSDVMQGSVSTSYDPEIKERTLKGSAIAYANRFEQKLEMVLRDGFHPLVLGTYSEETIHLAQSMYRRAIRPESPFSIRVNYRFPIGRSLNAGESIRPESYGKALVDLYDQWIRDKPQMVITPLDKMLEAVLGTGKCCPWTKDCGGRFLSIGPNGDVFNCADFADTGEEKFRFGNIFQHSMAELLSSKPIRQIRRRSVSVPDDCMTCEHFSACQGGCARDSYLFNGDIYGKFHYCASWKMVFSRIKESIDSGEADHLINFLSEISISKVAASCS